MTAEAVVVSHAVELAAFEQDKENVRPKRSGRSAATLAEVFGEKPSHLDEERKQRKVQFEAKLAEASAAVQALSAAQGPANAGVLESSASQLAQLWLSYATWAAEWYPSTPSEEQAVLERGTQALASQPALKDDSSYLQLWLRLADTRKEPQEVFNFLWSNAIGSGLALFYEAWATSLERQRRFGEATEVVRVGLARGAQPSNRLQSFQEGQAGRTLQRVQQSVEDGEAEQSPAQVEQARPVLNSISEHEARLLHRPLERRALQSTELGCPLPGQGALASSRGSAGVLCLDDPMETTQRASIFDAKSDWSLPPAVEAAATKENDQAAFAANPWDSRRAAQRRAGVAGRTARRQEPSARAAVAATPLPIFVDEEFQENSYSLMPTSASSALSQMCMSPARGSRTRPEATGQTPPARRRRAGPGCSSSEPQEAEAAWMQRTPGAPSKSKESRRRTRACREEEEEDEASAVLAASFSSMRLRDEPPAKRMCLAASAVKSDTFFRADLPLSSVSASAPAAASSSPQTPPRRPRKEVTLKLNFEDEGDLAESAKGSWQRAAARSPTELQSRSGKASTSPVGSCMQSSFRHPSMESSHDRDAMGIDDCHDGGLSGLHALQALFRTGRGRDTSCSRLLIFED